MTNLSDHDVFWLARYAHNTLAPLIKAAQQYEPSVTHSIEMAFDHADAPYHKQPHLTIYVRAQNQPHTILARDYVSTSTADIDRVAETVQTFIDKEQAALEAAADAAAEVDAAADDDFEFQMERQRERADIERDEDAHDIELQNEMAGN